MSNYKLQAPEIAKADWLAAIWSGQEKDVEGLAKKTHAVAKPKLKFT